MFQVTVHFDIKSFFDICYIWWEYFQKNKENKEGKDSNKLMSKNHGLKWNIIKHKYQNENTPKNIRTKNVFLLKLK